MCKRIFSRTSARNDNATSLLTELALRQGENGSFFFVLPMKYTIRILLCQVVFQKNCFSSQNTIFLPNYRQKCEFTRSLFAAIISTRSTTYAKNSTELCPTGSISWSLIWENTVLFCIIGTLNNWRKFYDCSQKL